jgi:hypothetical protein
MTAIKYNVIFFMVIFLFLGCSIKEFIPQLYKKDVPKQIDSPKKEIIPQSSSVPKWMDNPLKEANGKVTAVGCSAIHIDGREAQKKLALKRAIDSIAMQVNTKVSMLRYDSRSDNSSSFNKISLHEVNNENIATKILDTYIDKEGKICIWIIKN